MQRLFHFLICISAAIGALLLLGAGFSGSMSAIQQAAVASMVAAWIVILHVVSTMLDRRQSGG